jgi:PIN domain nuclease of toxin-antitoxin system
MKLLLDTHVLIWWSLDSSKLTKKIYELLTDPDNTLVVSIASIWEMQVKVQLGKLDLVDTPQPEGMRILRSATRLAHAGLHQRK